MKRVFDLQDLPYHEAFALMADGEEQADAFQELLYYTRRVCAVEGTLFEGASPNPDETPMVRQLGKMAEFGCGLDEGRLITAWREWNAHYRKLQRADPVLELYDIIGLLAESHESSSWLWNREDELRRWVDSGASVATYPFRDRHKIVDAALCQRMIRIRDALHGWMRRDAIGNVVHHSDGDEAGR
jgi:hypothetical protein